MYPITFSIFLSLFHDNYYNKYGIAVGFKDYQVHSDIEITKKDLENTVKFINQHNIQGIKIHSTYVLKNTKLNELYLNKLYTPLTMEEYIYYCGLILENLRPDIIIYRITADAPKSELVAPEWNLHKKIVLNNLNKYFLDNDIYQGKKY